MTSTTAASDEIFDDPLRTPPSTDAETGTWDDSGSIRGFAFEKPTDPTNNIHDVVIEQEFEHDGLQCLLCRVTEYHRFGVHTRDKPSYGEFETYYLGCVHAPGVDSFQKGYLGTYIADCYPEDNWFLWSERSWSNRYPRHKPLREWARRRTERLAEGLARKHRDEL